MPKQLSRLLRFLVLFLFLSFATSCGGGTKGTGLKNFEGRLIDSAGNPLSDIEVTLTATGDTTVTDEQGQFELDVVVAGDVEFLFETDNLNLVTTVDSIPVVSAVVSVDFRLDSERATVTVERVDIDRVSTGQSNDSVGIPETEQSASPPSRDPVKVPEDTKSHEDKSTDENDSPDLMSDLPGVDKDPELDMEHTPDKGTFDSQIPPAKDDNLDQTSDSDLDDKESESNGIEASDKNEFSTKARKS